MMYTRRTYEFFTIATFGFRATIMEIPNTPKNLRHYLAQYVRNKTDDGHEIINLVHNILIGHNSSGRRDPKILDNYKLRMEAANFLVERGWGKPIQEINLEPAEGTEARAELKKYNVDELERLLVGVDASL